MRVCYYFLVFFLLVLPISLSAQCPPPGFPQPSNNCPTAPILCENLDGYCATINNSNTVQTFPGCPGWQLNNDEWFAFFAGSTTITIQVTPSNCSNGNQQGLQGGIYAGCGPPWNAMDLQCECTENPFILTSSNYVIGQIYYFVLDGCAGNVCDYTIDVLAGSTVGVPPGNPGPITGAAQVCQGSSSPYSILPVPAGTIYNWTITPAGMGTATGTGNNTTINWNASASGTAQVCVTVSNLCYPNTTPSCTTVEVLPKPTATLSGTGILCAGNSTPVPLTVNFTGNAPWTFTYRINGVAQPPITTSDNPYIIQATVPGTYTLQGVTAVTGGCVGTVSGSSSITQVTVTAATTSTAAFCGQSDGSVNLTPGGGNAPYMFLWSGGQTTEDLSNVPAGTYTVTVTDNNGCSKTVTATVQDNTVNVGVSGTVVANTTCNGGNGSIDASVNPAAGTYTYLWSNGATTQDLSNLTPGTYTLTVTTGFTCTGTAQFTVADNPNQPNLTATTVGTTCDQSNGSINLSASGGVAPYTFQWSGGQTTEDLSNIPAGTYDVTVTGANGCTKTLSVTVNNTNPPITASFAMQGNTTCIGGNGSITTTVSPAGNYTFLWSNGETTPNLTNLPPGSYGVTITLAGSCTHTATIPVTNQPLEPNITATTVSTICDQSNGAINLSVSGGVAPYTFLWSNGAVTQNLSAMPNGTYDVTVTGANGCTKTGSFTINNNNPPININGTVVASTTCNGNGNGSITLNVTPAGAYTFVWSTGATTQNLTNMAPGTYDVTVTLTGSCTNTASFTIPDLPNLPNINGTPLFSTCDLNNGGVNITVSGGVSPYTFLWSNGATTQNITGIPSATYAVTVTGANGCSNEASFFVPNNNPFININGNVLASTTCTGNGNGSITLIITPGGAYTYLWSTGATTPNLSNLAPGDYDVTVTLSGSCTNTASFNVPDNPNEPNISGNETASTCELSNGKVDISVTGGVTPYSYLWSTGTLTQDLNNIPSGVYTVTVTGANGCTSTADFIVDNNNPPIFIDVDITPSTTCVGGNGRINITVTPSGSYTYLWSNGAVTQDLNNIPAGSYSVVVSGQGSCSETAFFDVPADPILPSFVLDFIPATCGLSNGRVNLAITGGVGPYTYLWSTGAKTQNLLNVPSDVYFVTVTGANGCTAVDYGVVPDDIVPIFLTGTVTPKTSCTTNNGRIVLNLNPPGMTLAWSGGQPPFSTLNNLAPGTYTVTVSAGGTCTETASFTVPDETQVPGLASTATAAICGLTNGAVDLQVTGGLAPFTYKWSNDATTQDLSALPPGTYSVTVTSAGNCTAVSSVTVPNNNIAINITGVVGENTSCTAGNGNINITATPAGNTYSYAWSNSAVTEDLGNLNAGAYTVVVSAGNSCSSSASFAVGNNTAKPVIVPAVTAAICGASNGGIDLTVSGAAAPYTYLWSNTAVTQDITGVLSGIYTVVVTDNNGCTADTTLNIPNNSSTFSLSGLAVPLTNCAQNNGAIDLTVTPPGPYTILWSNMASSEDLNGLPPGTYTVSVTETGNCTASTSFIIEDNRIFPATTQSIIPDTCDLSTGSINLGVSGGTLPYTFKWSNSGGITEDLVNLAAGTYTVLVTDANMCTATATAVVPNNAFNFSLAGIPVANSSCSTNNGAIDLSLSPATPAFGAGYTYNWSNAAKTEDLAGIPGGAYSVTVSAGGTCTSEASFTVASNVLLPVTARVITPSVCAQSNGSIDLTVSDGVAPFTFQWSNNTVNEDLNAIPPGSYTVTVTGANGCTSTNSFVVSDDIVLPAVTGTVLPNTSCFNSDGSIALNVTPNTLTYTYQWSGGQTTPNLASLAPGDYTVTINGGGACTSVETYTVGNTALSPNIARIITPASCAKNNGAIDLTVTGGITPYGFAWSNSGVNEDLSAIPAGNYTVTVSSANGCISTATYVVPDNVILPNVAGVATPNTSCLASNGGIVLSVNPPGTYTYLWSNSQTQPNLDPIAPGIYTVTVSGGGACTATESFTVANDAVQPALTGTTTDILCFGEKKGAIDMTVNGGAAPFVYNWAPGIPGSPQDPAGLTAGNYAVTVTDALGCTGTATFAIIQPASSVQVACSLSKPVSMPGAGDGSGKVNIQGGVAPYAIIWSPGSAQSNVPAGSFAINNLAEGNYFVTVTDANGCTTVCDFTIGLINCTTAIGTMSATPLSLCGTGCLTATYNNTGQAIDPDDVLQFILHEGTGNKVVNEIARSTQPKFCFDPVLMVYGKTYRISAAIGNNDGNGNVDLDDYCTAVTPGTPIVFNEIPIAGLTTPGVINCANPQVPLTGSSTLSGSTFSWSTAGGAISGNPAQAVVNAIKAGAYTLIVTSNGCSDTIATQVSDITNQPQAVILANPDDVLDCTISEIILSGIVQGSANANTVWVSNGNVYSNSNPVPINEPGTYEFIVVDTLTYCTDTAKIEINENLAYPPLFLNPPGILTCMNNTVTLTGGSPFPGINFAWATVSGNDTTILGTGTSFTVNAPGTYFLIGNDPSNSCVNALSTTVNADNSLPVADAGVPFSIPCFGETAFLDGSGSTGLAGLTYWWTTPDGHIVSGATTAQPAINEPGTYTLVVTNPGSGCTGTDVIVVDPEPPVASVLVNQPRCFGNKGSIVVENVAGGKPPLRYSLDNGVQFTGKNIFTNLNPGDYSLLIEDANGCSTTASATINPGELLEITLEPTATVKFGDSYQINTQISVPLSDIQTIGWTPAATLSCDSCLNPVAKPLNTTRYQINVVSAGGCRATAPLLLVVDKHVNVYVPNIFSPNGDGVNDLFTIYADPKAVLKIKSFQVFSRWGELVYEYFDFAPNSPAIGWDGKHRGKDLNPAVFVWYAVLEYADGQEVLYEGDVTLDR